MDGAPNFRVDGRVALVTGAGRGIGLAIAKALCSAGAAVAIQDIEPDVAEREAEAIRQTGARAIALDGDLTDPAIAPRLIDRTRESLGGLHILINNGAIQIEKPWLEQTADDMLRVYRANNVTPLMLCQLAARIFIRQRWGRIINIGSLQQRWPVGGMLPYAMSKASLSLMTHLLARDMAQHNVTVNQIAPGWTNTYRNRADFPPAEEKVSAGKAAVPLGRVGEPEDFGGVAVLLCSEAGGYITGQDIYVDGGLSVR